MAKRLRLAKRLRRHVVTNVAVNAAWCRKMQRRLAGREVTVVTKIAGFEVRQFIVID